MDTLFARQKNVNVFILYTCITTAHAHSHYTTKYQTRTPVINHGQSSDRNPNQLPMLTYDSDTADTTALAVIKGGGTAGYPFDSGLYLFPDNNEQLEYEPPSARYSHLE